jgi:hypothetical protein
VRTSPTLVLEVLASKPVAIVCSDNIVFQQFFRETTNFQRNARRRYCDALTVNGMNAESNDNKRRCDVLLPAGVVS